MDVLEAIKGRRSIRKYKADPVPEELMRRLVEAGQWAPTGANRQNWKFIAVTDPKLMRSVKRISPMMWGEAPAAILVCQDLTRSRAPPEGGSGGTTGFASQNIMLAAYSLGLGTCAIGGFNRVAARDLLDVPNDMAPLLLITVGYPDETPEVRPRRPFSEVAYLNSCRNPWGAGDE